MDTRVQSEELGFCARVQDGELAFDARVWIEDLASVTKEVFAEENSNSPLTCFAHSLVSQENGAKHASTATADSHDAQTRYYQQHPTCVPTISLL